MKKTTKILFTYFTRYALRKLIKTLSLYYHKLIERIKKREGKII